MDARSDRLWKTYTNTISMMQRRGFLPLKLLTMEDFFKHPSKALLEEHGVFKNKKTTCHVYWPAFAKFGCNEAKYFIKLLDDVPKIIIITDKSPSSQVDEIFAISSGNIEIFKEDEMVYDPSMFLFQPKYRIATKTEKLELLKHFKNLPSVKIYDRVVRDLGARPGQIIIYEFQAQNFPKGCLNIECRIVTK